MLVCVYYTSDGVGGVLSVYHYVISILVQERPLMETVKVIHLVRNSTTPSLAPSLPPSLSTSLPPSLPLRHVVLTRLHVYITSTGVIVGGIIGALVIVILIVLIIILGVFIFLKRRSKFFYIFSTHNMKFSPSDMQVFVYVCI